MDCNFFLRYEHMGTQTLEEKQVLWHEFYHSQHLKENLVAYDAQNGRKDTNT